MADIRALLKTERQSRRVNDIHAVYTKSGTLSCRLCQEVIKSEALWDKHLQSERHRSNARQLATSQETKRKRMEEDDEDNEDEGLAVRKKLRTPIPEVDDPVSPAEAIPLQPQLSTDRGTVDENEWAAFERDVLNDAQQPPSAAVSALTAAPTVSAAAMTQAEVEAKRIQEEEEEALRTNAVKAMDDELSAEKEDAARQREEEFETMESLEAKVLALKKKREAVRAAEGDVNAKKVAELTVDDKAEPEGGSSEDDDDDNVDDEWEGWRVRGK